MTKKQEAALRALRNEGPLQNSYRFSACTLNSLVAHGYVRITKGHLGARKCTYELTTAGRNYAASLWSGFMVDGEA